MPINLTGGEYSLSTSADQVTFTPPQGSGLSSTNVQDVVVELSDDKTVEQIATDATTSATLPILLAKTSTSGTVTEEVRKDPSLTYSPIGNNINFETGVGQNISPHLFLTTRANAGAGAQGDEECVVLQKNVDSNNSTTIYMHNGATSRGLTVQNKVSGSMTSKKLLTVNNSNQISSDCIVGEALSNIRVVTTNFYSGSPLNIPVVSAASYGVYVILGFFQGIGAIFIEVEITNNAIGGIYNIRENTNFSSAYYTFTYSTTTGLTVTSTLSSRSTVTGVYS